jgi:hypothetical protein
MNDVTHTIIALLIAIDIMILVIGVVMFRYIVVYYEAIHRLNKKVKGLEAYLCVESHE